MIIGGKWMRKRRGIVLVIIIEENIEE